MNPFARSGKFMLLIAWLLILGGFFWFFSDWGAQQNNPNTVQVLNAQQGDLTLLRNRAGHYVASGAINGHAVDFMVDTGATAVALPAALARELGLKRGAALTLQTANGQSTGYETRLDRVRIGSLEMHDVAAIIANGMDDDTVLLGMSFLKRVEISQRGERLILRPLAGH